jgi:hypothetical protein
VGLVLGLVAGGPRGVVSRLRLVVVEAALVDGGLGDEALGIEIARTGKRIGGNLDPRLGGLDIGFGGLQQQKIVRRIEPGEHVAGCDVIADVHPALDHLTGDAERQNLLDARLHRPGIGDGPGRSASDRSYHLDRTDGRWRLCDLVLAGWQDGKRDQESQGTK